MRLKVRLEVCEQLLPDVRRVAQHNVKTGACISRCIFTVNCYSINSKLCMPIKRQGVKICIIDQAVAVVKVGLQPGQLAAQLGRFKPQ